MVRSHSCAYVRCAHTFSLSSCSTVFDAKMEPCRQILVCARMREVDVFPCECGVYYG